MFKKIILFFMVLFLTSCGGGGGGNAPNVQTPTEIESISFIENSHLLFVGESKKLLVTFNPSSATDKTLLWSSSDTNIVTVDKEGTITAKNVGLAEISATSSNGKKTSVNIEVVEEGEYITSIEIITSKNVFVIGDTLSLTAKYLPENAKNNNLVWSSSDETVATVDSTGNVEFLKEGNVIIRVSTEKNISSGKTFIVKENNKPEILGMNIIPNGKEVSLTAIVKDNEENLDRIEIDWGDGNVDNIGKEDSLNENHIYNQYNNYQIVIKAYDEKGLYSEGSQEIILVNLELPEIFSSNLSLTKESTGLIKISGRNIQETIGAIEFIFSYNPKLASIEEISTLGVLKDALKIIDDKQYGKIKIGIAGIPKSSTINDEFLEFVIRGKDVGIVDFRVDSVKVLNENATEIRGIITSDGTIKIEEAN